MDIDAPASDREHWHDFSAMEHWYDFFSVSVEEYLRDEDEARGEHWCYRATFTHRTNRRAVIRVYVGVYEGEMYVEPLVRNLSVLHVSGRQIHPDRVALRAVQEVKRARLPSNIVDILDMVDMVMSNGYIISHTIFHPFEEVIATDQGAT